MADVGQRRLVTPISRLSYPAVIDPKPVMGDDTKKQYSAELLIDPADLTKFKYLNDAGELEAVDIRAVCADVAREKWGSDFDVDAAKKGNTLGWPLKNGNDFANRREQDGKDGEHYRGNVYVRTKGSENFAPVLKFFKDSKFHILDRANDIELVREYFTAGNYVLAEVTVKAVETPAKEKFVTFYLNGVCYMRKGARLGSGGSLLDERLGDSLVEGIVDFDPAEGMEDPIAL